MILEEVAKGNQCDVLFPHQYIIWSMQLSLLRQVCSGLLQEVTSARNTDNVLRNIRQVLRNISPRVFSLAVRIQILTKPCKSPSNITLSTMLNSQTSQERTARLKAALFELATMPTVTYYASSICRQSPPNKPLLLNSFPSSGSLSEESTRWRCGFRAWHKFATWSLVLKGPKNAYIQVESPERIAPDPCPCSC